jgi:cytochrome b pre-mRNA-processing protein 3
MLNFLFRGLTAGRQVGAPLFDALTAQARRPDWYIEGRVPDTLDGRFAVLATLIALTLVRLESGGEAADRLSVALTERFIEVMESEHRELGLGDPALGKTVRKLVRMLGKRTELWRKASSGRSDWTETTRASLYKGEVGADALRHSAAALWRFDKRLVDSPLAGIEQGEIA